VHVSVRLARLGGEPNPLAAARSDLLARGVALTELTDTNPTNHGLLDERVLEILARATRRAGRYDPDPRGWLGAREALAGRFGGEPDDYWLTASTSQAYGWLFTLLTDPGQAVATPTPGYPLIEPLARLADARVADYRTHYLHPTGWEYDLDTVRAALARPQTRALVVVNPGNPTGAYTEGATAAALGEACAARGLPLLADEVFRPFVLEAAPPPAGPPGRLADAVGTTTVFTLDGLSKLLCAPQVKLGWIRASGPGHERWAPHLDRIADAYLGVGSPVALALPELLELADDAVARVRARLSGNLATLRAVFGDGGYRVRTAHGGWMALLDVPPVLDDSALALHLLSTAHLSVHPGWFYDLDSPAPLALSLLPSPTAFAAGGAALRRAVDALA